MYRCLRCKWAFMVNDERRGSLRCATDRAGELTREEAVRRIGTFAEGPCPGYQGATQESDESRQASNVVPMRRENRSGKAARDARAM
jgi:hypothetical protein